MLIHEDREILNETYRNTKMAVDAIYAVIGKIEDEDLALDLNRQVGKFNDFKERAEEKLLENGYQPEKSSAAQQMMLKISAKANAAMDTSAGHIADMMIQGNTKGIVSMLKTVNANKNASTYAYELANELMDFEERTIEKLKDYL